MKCRVALVFSVGILTVLPAARAQETSEVKPSSELDFLTEALWHAEPRIRQSAVSRLSEMPEKPFDAMVKVLTQGTQFQVATAAIVLRNLKDENEPIPEETLEALYGILSNPATETWRWNITATLLSGVPADRQTADDAGSEEEAMSPRETGIAEASLKDHVDLWTWGVNHPSPLIQLPSLRALQKTGEDGKPAQRAVENLLHRSRAPLTSFVLKGELVTDGKIGLQQALPAYDPLIILETLAAIKADPQLMVGPLTQLTAHPMEYVRLDAAALLGKIEAAKLSADPRPHAARVLADMALLPYGQVRVEATRELGNIGKSAAVAVPALIELLEDRNDDVRLQAVMSLGKLGPIAKEALPALRIALRYAALDTQAMVDAIEAAIESIESAGMEDLI